MLINLHECGHVPLCASHPARSPIFLCSCLNGRCSESMKYNEILRVSARSLKYWSRIGHLRLILDEFKALCDVTPRFEETLFDENGANKLVNTRTVIKLLKLLASSRSNFQNCEPGRLDITRGTFKTILFSLCCCANCCRFPWAPLNSARRVEIFFRGKVASGKTEKAEESWRTPCEPFCSACNSLAWTARMSWTALFSVDTISLYRSQKCSLACLLTFSVSRSSLVFVVIRLLEMCNS